MQDKKVLYSVIISIVTFLFIGLLIYIIYCYGFYDNNIKTSITDMYNKKQFDQIYEILDEKDTLNKEDYENVLSLMYDQSKLEEIYKKYYENSTIWKDELSFLSDYYYGENKIEIEDIKFKQDGKTNLMKRANFYIDSIKVKSKSGIVSALGVRHNLKLLIDQNGNLMLDNMIIECSDGICNVPIIYKGIHEIKYESNGYEYYGLLNIKDEEEISITNIDTLVTIKSNNTNQKIKKGYYYLKECYMESSCPSKSKSYIHVIDDKNIELYTYISLDQAGDFYKGTYNINNGFINLSFDKHTYSVFDYDTKRSTDINVDVNINMSFKIIDSYGLQNNDYYYTYTN